MAAFTTTIEPTEFRRAFCSRVRALRCATGMTQAAMATALGVGTEAYRAYESRSPLPHHLVELFAALTGAGVEELFERGDPGAAVPEPRGVEPS